MLDNNSVISCPISFVFSLMETSLMPVLVKQATVGGEGGRASERGLSAKVSRRCCWDSTGAPVDPVQMVNKINNWYVFSKFKLQKRLYYCCVHWDWGRQWALLSHCDRYFERHMRDHYGSSCQFTNGLHLLWGMHLYGLWCCRYCITHQLTPSFVFEPSQVV